MKLKGPYETDIIVHVTGKGNSGEIKISLSMGTPPTQKEIDACIAKATEAAEENGMRLMNKEEFFNAMMEKRAGLSQRVAIPGGKDWDA